MKKLLTRSSLALFFTTATALVDPSLGGGSSPVPRSDVILGLEWIGEMISYPDPATEEEAAKLGPAYGVWFYKSGPAVRGDTHPMTWADDNEIYTSSGDPNWGEQASGLDVERFSGEPPDYRISKVNEMLDYLNWGSHGPKPSGMLCVDGVLYLAVQNTLGFKKAVHGRKNQHGSDATIIRSRDHGLTWEPERKSMKEPMFPDSAFGGPAFLNFGRNNEGARDHFVYAVSADQWDNGTHLRLGRVPVDQILDVSSWEWVAGFAADHNPVWSNRLNEAIPILSRHAQTSLPEMVYLSSIQRYLLLTWCLKKEFDPNSGSDLFIYDAPEPWGPFTLAHHESEWQNSDVSPYCPRLPLKWLSQSETGITGWLQFSGDWQKDSPYYRSNIRQFRLLLNR